VPIVFAARDGARRGREIENTWKYTGRKRPPFAEAPGPGQESVWDYPRPPKVVADQQRVAIRFGNRIIADSISTYRVLETSSPPTKSSASGKASPVRRDVGAKL
jgi:hypothetical protein